MKTIVYAWLLFLSSVSVTLAQTEKGRWTVGASVGSFTYSTQNGYKSFSGSLTPSAGYLVVNNLQVGLGVPFSISSSTYYNPNGDAKSSSTSIGVSPYVRYYFGSSKLKPYVGLSYSYSRTDQHVRDVNQDLKGNGFTSTVTPTVGVAYFINRSVALTAGLGYIWERYRTAYAYNDVNGNPVAVPVSTAKYMSLGIGFQIFLGQ